MRIGIDATPAFLRKGGIGYYVHNLLGQLLRIDSENEYFLFVTTRERPESSLPFLDQPQVQVVYTPKNLQKWRARRERIDLYHGTNFRLRGVGRKHNVVTIHDLAFKHYPQFLKRQFGQSLAFWKTKRDVQRADRVITVSHHTAKDAIKFFQIDQEKIRVVHHGVTEVFRPDVGPAAIERVRNKYQIGSSPYLLCVGTLEPRKNLVRLLEMYRAFTPINSAYDLVLAGGRGWQDEAIHQQAEALAPRVHLTGYLPPEDLPPLYAGATLMIYPSLYEGFGMPLLEAMASGVPVVASNTSAIPEVVGDAAVLFDPVDIAEMGEAVLRVLRDPALAADLRSKGLARAGDFTWERAARETLAVYQELELRSGNGHGQVLDH